MTAVSEVSLGIGVESVYGTGVTPTRWFEFLDEGLTYAPNMVQGQGLAATGKRVDRTNRRAIVSYDGGGPFSVEMFSKGLGLLLRAAFGTGVSTLVSGTTYQQQFTLGDSPASLTAQKGVVAGDGVVYPQTFRGGLIKSFELAAQNNDIVKMNFDLDAQSMVTGTAYATPSYPSGGSLFTFAHGAVMLGGTITAPTTTALSSGGDAAANIRSATVSVDNGYTDTRYNFGGGGLKSQPTRGKRVIAGGLEIEYTNNLARDAILSDTALSLVLLFTSTEALSTGYAQLEVFVPSIKLGGELPKASGELPVQSVSFAGLDNGTAAEPIVLSLRTSDTAL